MPADGLNPVIFVGQVTRRDDLTVLVAVSIDEGSVRVGQTLIDELGERIGLVSEIITYGKSVLRLETGWTGDLKVESCSKVPTAGTMVSAQ